MSTAAAAATDPAPPTTYLYVTYVRVKRSFNLVILPLAAITPTTNTLRISGIKEM